ncbi:MAG: arginine--tRNA ligase, partial [Candidatus Dojkabacteria bacterium]|nr:arginine--tRNA ligase [Candidatus Dojkabacteria bacterium]
FRSGEVVWRDSHSVTCRMWNWRQSERTKVTKSTTDIYFIFDYLDELDLPMEDIIEKFTAELSDVFGAKVQSGVISKENPEWDVDYRTKSIDGVEVEEDLKQLAVQGSDKKKSAKSHDFMKRKSSVLDLHDESTMISRINRYVTGLLTAAGVTERPDLTVSAQREFGDLSSSLPFRVAGAVKQSPTALAERLVETIKEGDRNEGVFGQVSVAGKGFVNFGLSGKFLMSELKNALNADEFGNSTVGRGRAVLIESPSINPNAAAHIGHLLNLFIGRSLKRLFEKSGFLAVNDNLINDRGIKICMAMWGVANLSDHASPEDAGQKSDHFVGSCYVRAKELYKTDPNVKKEIDQMLRDWEANKPEAMSLWEKVVGWAYKGHLETFERLNEERGHVWLESELYKKGRDIIEKQLGKGVVEQLPDGAVVGRLEEKYGVPDVVLLRSDGTSLYHTQDVYLTLQKIEKFDPWRAVWVVGNEQIAHFQQLFALLDALGILDLEKVYHLAYGIVVDPQGERIGKKSAGVTADAILDQMRDTALSVMEQRKIAVDVDDKRAVAEQVGIGALRYAFLSRDPYGNVVYDPDSAVSFTGRSGPYIMYTYARGKSVLRKAFGEGEYYGGGGVVEDIPSSVDLTEEERAVLLRLLMYPETVLASASRYAPNILADYLYEVAREFNYFYEKQTINKAEGDVRAFRLALTVMMTKVIGDGLRILGIEPLERM